MKLPDDILNEQGITGKFRFHNDEGIEFSRFDVIYAMGSYAQQFIDVDIEVDSVKRKRVVEAIKTFYDGEVPFDLLESIEAIYRK